MKLLGISRTTMNDWLNLLQGPAEPPFTAKSDFQEPWPHLLRLVTLVLILVTVVLTFSYLGLKASEKDEIVTAFLANTVTQTRFTVMIILVGALFAVLYALMLAPLFKVRITVPQTFFTFLFVLLPWIPIVTVVWVLGYIVPDIPLMPFFIPIFIFVLFPFFFVVKFAKALCFVSDSGWGKCLASIALPFLIFFVLVIWISLRSQSIDEAPVESDSISVLRKAMDIRH